MVIEFHVVQSGSEIIVDSPCTLRLVRLISDQFVLHSDQLPSYVFEVWTTQIRFEQFSKNITSALLLWIDGGTKYSNSKKNNVLAQLKNMRTKPGLKKPHQTRTSSNNLIFKKLFNPLGYYPTVWSCTKSLMISLAFVCRKLSVSCFNLELFVHKGTPIFIR